MRYKKLNINRFILGGALLALSSGMMNAQSRLSDGKWRGEFEAGSNRIPFVFLVANSATDSATVTLANGDERVPLRGITYRGDSVFIPIQAYDAELRGIVKGKTFDGRFVKHFIDNDPGVKFAAVKTDAPRFEKAGLPTSISPDGEWDVNFIAPNGDIEKNVGTFQSRQQIVTGSFLTDTGDLRFLEGARTNNGFELSAFAGLSPYLVRITFEGNDKFTGEFVTTRGVTRLSGIRNAKAALQDPYSFTKVKGEEQKLNFTLPDVNGNQVSVTDAAYKGKVVIVSILGSWCPNCLDEMKFLVPWYNENKDRGVEIIGLAFERKSDPEYAKRTLSSLEARYNVPYKILFAGKVGEETTSKVLPQLTKIVSYPTTIFLDKQGNVRKIHTGFNGPATGKFYEEFKEDFNATVNELLNEK